LSLSNHLQIQHLLHPPIINPAVNHLSSRDNHGCMPKMLEGKALEEVVVPTSTPKVAPDTTIISTKVF
jgi:hypothetical protein